MLDVVGLSKTSEFILVRLRPKLPETINQAFAIVQGLIEGCSTAGKKEDWRQRLKTCGA
jgi:hypothetical protein